MAIYTINDFQVGETVYHLSNTKIKMAIIQITAEKNEIVCRWLDAKGQKQVSEFMPQELGKGSDLSPRFFSI